ncbi:MAG: Fis family transcriptional regulator [Deltaproteobacteria bacterium]|nr:Fis family transcriptional regulator [Deltaproteobacteria bacterium]
MSLKPHILVVDDELSMRDFLEILFRREGYRVTAVDRVQKAVACLENDHVDLVMTDMQMPEGSGLEVMRHTQALAPKAMVVVITAFASTDNAISAMREGAYDYLTKPFKVDEVKLVVRKALEKKLLSSENLRLKRELKQSRSRSLVGSSEAMQSVFRLMAQVALTKTTVLVSGESGTGKELVARGIHDEGNRANGPFVAVNCGAIPENLLESELFGHLKGAFTGADGAKQGLFAVAEGGTLFLDEVSELSLALQVKLLRVIQEKKLRPVGDTVDRDLDVRVISATNRNLAQEVEEGRFRRDLYYRLNVVEVEVPPLRERREDIPLLVRNFVRKYAAEMDRDIDSVSDAAMQTMMAYGYPGNVRELENITERAMALSQTDKIDLDSLPDVLKEVQPSLSVDSRPIGARGLEARLQEYERAILDEALRQSGGVKTRAAAQLGISFRSFRYRFQKLSRSSDSSESEGMGESLPED